jgi:hypothetical protein
MQGDIAVEPPGGPGIRRVSRERYGRVRPGQVDAVVAQEDPEAVGGVGIADQVRGRGRGDLSTPRHNPAYRSDRTRPRPGGSARPTDSRSTSDSQGRTVPLATDP